MEARKANPTDNRAVKLQVAVAMYNAARELIKKKPIGPNWEYEVTAYDVFANLDPDTKENWNHIFGDFNLEDAVKAELEELVERGILKNTSVKYSVDPVPLEKAENEALKELLEGYLVIEDGLVIGEQIYIAEENYTAFCEEGEVFISAQDLNKAFEVFSKDNDLLALLG